MLTLVHPTGDQEVEIWASILFNSRITRYLSAEEAAANSSYIFFGLL
jgi:hypothetical protein